MIRLLELILRKRIRRLVLTHKDRLRRFGSELIFALCELQNIEIVIINKGDPPSFEEELAQDVIDIITVFSARLYGRRSHKTKQLLETLHANEERHGNEETGGGRRGVADDPATGLSPKDKAFKTSDSALKAATIQQAWRQAIGLYLDLMEERDAPGP